ncbi:MAG: tRNA nucleotidyltransferase [Oscillospiraceae bacterium]|nr:tRNA nucleotidyltransferase [Oscillospiraceae bacterium]
MAGSSAGPAAAGMTGRRDPARDMEAARDIARQAASLGGAAYYVGGFVRDRLLGRENTDVDIEVHGVTPRQLAEILDGMGGRLEMGASFGIYGLKGYGLDIAMPRRERATGRGHRDFQVSVDPFLGTEQAARRRDFTVNALMENVLTGQVLDHFHGLDDLRRGILRHVDSRTFPEDPLRVLRGAQFAARFRFAVAPETVALCRDIDLAALPPERVEGELCKALLQADRPSLFFETLRDMGQLSPWFPEVEALIGVPQEPGFHQEGDVWNHTMLVLDQAAALRSRARRPFAFMLAALTHDLGKTVTTQRVRGRIHAYAHETAGVPLAEALLRRIVGEKAVTAYVLNMVELHMKPNALVGADASVKASNRMFDRSVEPEDLILLAAADGRGTRGRWPWEDTEPWLRQRLALYREIMARPQVTGAELIAAGLTPDSRFRELLDYAHKLHLAGIPHDSALKQTLAYARKRK